MPANTDKNGIKNITPISKLEVKKIEL